ncbi:MAG: hypothetical protein II865_11025 [Bacteroidales bacterium]|nr:hypothetical protein [Bacteroidales bacterium]
MTNFYPTIDDVLKYVEVLVDAVEKQLAANLDPKTKDILLKLQVLLKTNSVKTFVEQLHNRKFSISSFKKIEEIDDALDELRIMSLQLPYPEECFVLDQEKKKRRMKNVTTAIFCAICGFNLVD